ncbi:hypothetical protein Rhe02_38210 [Rhizocola hellebori]|uniref:Uncharacterized protein n=1 Tax=Rhizocola hellebori TaxID=1392758 RepID=A0A8J3VFX1_9ACTN|nr:hypothetical protein [Rhizocola hellebori]GIH05754.1 hypothetical protein Rhe02_38210 [Rhizocola hellebori]
MSEAIRLSAAVMTHPSRLPAAQALCDLHPELGLRIVVDPLPTGPPSAARAAVRAWAAVDPDATHHLVLQDDVLLGESFAERLLAAIAQRPGDAICLFTEWACTTSYAVRLAAWLGHRWVEVCDPYLPTVASVLPAHVARVAGNLHPVIPQDDVLLSELLQRLDIRAFAVVPNMAQHDTKPSLTGNHSMGLRLAACFSGDTGAFDTPAIDLFPCFSRSYPRPFYLHRSPSGWAPRHPMEVLAERAVDTASLRRLAAQRAAALCATRSELRPDVAAGLWLTAWALGAEVVSLLGDDPVGVCEALDRDTGWLGVTTLARGVFDRYLPAWQLEAAGPFLDEYTAEAFTEGVLKENL